jgi:acid phosphatase type 7
MMLFSGDVINLATDQGEWEEWLDNAEQLAAPDAGGGMPTYLTLPTILTMEAHGNHDNHTALFFGNLTMPQDNVKYPQYGELFYSMDIGPVHAIVMDDSWVADPSGDANYAGVLKSWLDADLTAANANRTNVPWIVTVHHRSDYSSSLHGMDSDVLATRAFFAPIWQQYHVDMAFGGHDHDYERSQPLDIGADINNPTATTPAQGTTFVVCAGSGADPYSSGMSSFTAVSQDFVNDPGGVLGFYGMLTADAHNLTLTAHQLKADASDPVLDTYTITK